MKKQTVPQALPNMPFSYENWQAYLCAKPYLSGFEVDLFTDAVFKGEQEVVLGPYKVIGTSCFTKRATVKPALVLRAALHLSQETSIPSLSRTNEDIYHGGWLPDELAALLSLALGIRCKRGGSSRSFKINGDAFGTPRREASIHTPKIGDYPRLPYALTDRLLSDASLMNSYPLLPVTKATSLLRVARLYQDAMWIEPNQPFISWLLLVSAVEVAAESWHSSKLTPVERLREFKPELEILLQENGGHSLVEKVAKMIVDITGSTKKFVEFLMNYMPPPPPERPPAHLQVSWRQDSLRRNLRLIYSYRSRALHGGIPFPMPMCQPPIERDNVIPERAYCNAIYSFGGVWLNKDLPMHLHVFEYIARSCIVNWWKELATSIMST